jgi:peptidoglycan/LPS O-acetylase OafA/YrhL
MTPFNKPCQTGKEMIYIDEAIKDNMLTNNNCSNEKRGKIYFEGLNELRAFAALAVIYHHVEQNNYFNPIKSHFTFLNYFTGNLGKNGVFLFFVLSGFLITYLLLQEKAKYNTVFLKKFFLRRIFRIWPLYYLIFALSVLVIPYLALHFDIFKEDISSYDRIIDTHNYGIKGIVFYLFFMPNVALYSGYFITGCSQAWSVGVEEQFYILWPFLIMYFNKNRIVQVFLIVLFLIPVLIFLAKNNYIIYPLSVIIKCIPFHFMAIGSIGGYLFFTRNQLIEKYTHSKWGYICIIGFIYCFLFHQFFSSEIQEIVISFLFLLLILFTINNKNHRVFRNIFFSYLGKISYGMYMYHIFVMFLVFPFINKYVSNFQGGIYYNVLLYPLIFIITILLSSLSYQYFELKFIKIKETKFKTL